MKMQKLIVRTLYVILFFLCCWTWLYAFAASSDIPVNISYEEFINIESNILVIFFLFIYLSIKGNPIINICLLFIPNFFWIFEFVNDLTYSYHIYDTIFSSSMMVVMTIMFLLNIYLIRRNMKNELKRTH
jgi:hypothetical protein